MLTIIITKTSVIMAVKFDLPTENPDMRPLLEVESMILVKTSMTNRKRRGNKGSFCQSPLEAEKN